MKLIIIYGPPAAGKLTVSTKLARLIGFEIFHNHLTYDLFHQVSKIKDGDFWEKVNGLRFELIELAAKNDINLIFTICYESDEVDFIEEIKKRVSAHGGEIYYVHLTPTKEALLHRVSDESRKKFRKLSDPIKLAQALEEKEYYQSINEPNSIVIDNTSLDPEVVAERIVAEFKL